jgi:hypothetical protein
LLLTANVVPGSQLLSTLMMVILASEASVLTRVTRCDVSEEGFLNTKIVIVVINAGLGLLEEWRLLGCYAVWLL